jgi:hypothetical protein
MVVEGEPSEVAEGAHEGAVGASLPMRSVERVITEIDGSMIPIVQVAPPSEGEPEDGRKRRQLEWNEARPSEHRPEHRAAIRSTPNGLIPIRFTSLGRHPPLARTRAQRQNAQKLGTSGR